MNGEIAGPGAAFVAGLITSLHCVGMCGPLAHTVCASPCQAGCAKQERTLTPALTYHTARIVSYTVLGGVAALLGRRISEAFLGGAAQGMLWVFALFFLAVALGFDKRIPLPRWGIRVLGNRGMRGAGAPAFLGFFTPTLPCAPLYLMVAAAALANSWLSGALIMAAFGAGTFPLLFVAQNRLAWLEARWGPRGMEWTRRTLAAVSLALVLARGFSSASGACLMCH